MSPQIHLVFDDYFKTVHTYKGQEPTIWAELMTFQTFRSDYDDEAYVPVLSDEWLKPDTLKARQLQQQTKKDVRTYPPVINEPYEPFEPPPSDPG
jgi:hypothetical protein